jgi:hypothetical protein
MTTMGQALDTAIKTHESAYPGSEVYHAEVKEVTQAYRVVLLASHFSVPMVYDVPIA